MCRQTAGLIVLALAIAGSVSSLSQGGGPTRIVANYVGASEGLSPIRMGNLGIGGYFLTQADVPTNAQTVQILVHDALAGDRNLGFVCIHETPNGCETHGWFCGSTSVLRVPATFRFITAYLWTSVDNMKGIAPSIFKGIAPSIFKPPDCHGLQGLAAGQLPASATELLGSTRGTITFTLQ